MLNQLSTTGYRRSAQTRWRRAQPLTDERDGRESRISGMAGDGIDLLAVERRVLMPLLDMHPLLSSA